MTLAAAPPPPRNAIITAAGPALFVLLWSSGFVGVAYGRPYAEPFTFLTLRFAIVVVLTSAMALYWRAPWPRRAREIGHIAVAGFLIQFVYLGGVFLSIYQGVPSGVSALIVSVQPLLTATVVGPMLGEHVSRRQWLGLGLGFVGVALVVSRTVQFEGAGLVGFAASVVALLGITAGTLYQKRYCADLDLRSGSTIQYVVAGLLTLLLSLLFETRHIDWTPEFVFALFWMTVVMSIGAISLFFVLIRRGAASRVVSLFYLVPPTTALLAYIVFGDKLDVTAILGLAFAAAGVALVNR